MLIQQHFYKSKSNKNPKTRLKIGRIFINYSKYYLSYRISSYAMHK